MNLRSLLQDILSEVPPKIISFQMELHLVITWVRSSEFFRFIESLRTCIMASHCTGLCVIQIDAALQNEFQPCKSSVRCLYN